MKLKKLVVLCSACGIGKSTIKDYFCDNNLLDNYMAIDTDDVGLNWWDYANSDSPHKYSEDSLKIAVTMAKEKSLLFVTCMNPIDFYPTISIPLEISQTYFISMTCSDEEITKRLKARPAERMCGSNEFIEQQIGYNEWFLNNRGKFQFSIDNTKQSIKETATAIAEYIKKID